VVSEPARCTRPGLPTARAAGTLWRKGEKMWNENESLTPLGSRRPQHGKATPQVDGAPSSSTACDNMPHCGGFRTAASVCAVLRTTGSVYDEEGGAAHEECPPVIPHCLGAAPETCSSAIDRPGPRTEGPIPSSCCSGVRLRPRGVAPPLRPAVLLTSRSPAPDGANEDAPHGSSRPTWGQRKGPRRRGRCPWHARRRRGRADSVLGLPRALAQWGSKARQRIPCGARSPCLRWVASTPYPPRT